MLLNYNKSLPNSKIHPIMLQGLLLTFLLSYKLGMTEFFLRLWFVDLHFGNLYRMPFVVFDKSLAIYNLLRTFWAMVMSSSTTNFAMRQLAGKTLFVIYNDSSA
jgi:hypothetical protein